MQVHKGAFISAFKLQGSILGCLHFWMKHRLHVRTWDIRGTQGRWFGNAFPFYLSIREKKGTVILEHYWRVGLEMKIQFFYKREKQK